MTRSTDLTAATTYGPTAPDADAMDRVRRQRRRDRDAAPLWWLSARLKPRSIERSEATA
jgi:hypothetical protein